MTDRTARRRSTATVAQRVLTRWARVAVHSFYRSIRVSGDWPLEPGRPAVIAVNHSNALGDVAVLLDVLPRFPHFLAAATWWRHAPARVLFRLGRVLPVQRRADGASTDGNVTTFAECTVALGSGGDIAIFPEGELNTGPELLPLRTGAARIGLGAATNGGVGGVAIVPVALAYSDRGKLGSDVVVQFGEPIDVDEWLGPDAAAAPDAARELTAVLSDRLGGALAHATAEVRRGAGAAPSGRRRILAEMVVLSPAAAVGAAVSAPAVVPIAIAAKAVRHEGWQATTKAVAATFLLPISWVVTGHALVRHRHRTRAWSLIAVGAGSGWATLAWLDRLEELAAA